MRSLLIALVLLAVPTVFGQEEKTTCDLSYKSLPAVQGISFNMQVADLGTSWRQMREMERDAEGETLRLFLDPKPNQSHGELTSADVELFDNKVWKFQLDYHTQAAWNDALQFGRNFGRALKLPDEWKFTSSLPSRAAL